ncbi:UNVERIFIED_CONTAM: Chaperone protein dnaJ 3 [Sesamum radiatum]|uniref:Chaperone protein dnaJ 3 n=1 Tax=Sesamum radiatum TaxID=300843 RepID=A0AAW2KTL6_SESRA
MFGRAPKKSNDLKFYEILGVPISASQDELKKAYKKAAIKNHPDKGGDPEKASLFLSFHCSKDFKELAHAYEILSDPEKREIYDEYGEDAVKEGMGGGSHSYDPFNIFESFFGGGFAGGFGGGRSSRSRKRQGEDVVHPLRVSLEDLYNGTTRKLSISQNVLCNKCKGKGSKSGTSGRCHGCQGTGTRTTSRPIGPGMIQRIQHICSDCRGSGELISERDRCSQCKGKKVAQEKKVLEVQVEKGMQQNQKIVFSGQADEAPDTITGDIVFVLQQREHPKFKRKYDDLYVEHNLNLREALCGFQFILTHLDGRKLVVKSNPGEVFKPDCYKAINDEGMPHYQRPFMKGQLYIHFNVEFPDSGFLSPEKSRILTTVLPVKSDKCLTDKLLAKCEETTLLDVNMEEEMRQKEQQRQREAYDEDDDDDDPTVHQVACNQQ